MDDLIANHWAQLLALITVVVWLVRLEASVKSTAKKQDEMLKRQVRVESKHDTLGHNLTAEISLVKQSLAKIEGWLAGSNRDSL